MNIDKPPLKDMLRSNLEQELAILQSLGLKPSEASLYLNLCLDPEGKSIEAILESSGIPSSEAEEALKNLVDKGILKLVRNKIEAVDPAIMTEIILERKRRESEDALAEARRLAVEATRRLQPLYLETRLGIRPEEIIEPLRDLREMEVRTTRMIAESQSSISIFAETFGWYDKVRESLIEALDRGVHARVIMMVVDEMTKNRARDLRELRVEVRHCAEEWYPVRGTLVDDQELVFLIWATRKKGISKPIYYRPNYTRNPGLIRIFADAFKSRWDKAHPI
jgi:sugar-specific transcriptional regulator TrmB